MLKLLPPVLFLLILTSCSRTKQVQVVAPVVRAAYTVEQRVAQYGPAARKRWRSYFRRARVSYPPNKLVFLGLKSEGIIEVYADDARGRTKLIRRIPICAASGRKGPKLREGDMQVPEGIYRITFLNANSRFHLSLRISYPNQYDRFRGWLEGETQLGGDIMIHGDCVSAGCLAVRDEAAEDLFILAADSGISRIKVILAPFDFRRRPITLDDLYGLPVWTSDLYSYIDEHLRQLPLSK